MKTKALAGVLLLVVAAALLVARDYDAPGLGRAALEHAREATGMRLDAESLRFHPLRGIELEGVSARSRFPGGSYDVEVRRILLGYRPSSILSGRIVVERAVLVEPRIVLTLGAAPGEAPEGGRPRSGPTEPPASSESGAPLDGSPAPVVEPLDVRLSHLGIEAGSLAVRSRAGGEDRISFHGLALALDDVGFDRGALTLLHAIGGTGALAIERLEVQSTEVTSVSGRVRAEGGRFTLAELGLDVERDRFEGELDVDFNVLPFRYALSLTGSYEEPDAWTGPAELRLEASGFGVDSRNLSGGGSIVIPPGVLPDAPWMREIEEGFAVELAGLSHEGARARFRVASNLVTVEPFRTEAPPYGLEAEGTIDLDGPLHLRLALTESSRGTLGRMRLFGTLAEPELDRE